MAKVTALSSLAWSNYTLYEALPRLAARGCKRIEIASFNSYCFHFNFGNPTPKELRKMLDAYGMTPVALNYHTSQHSECAWVPEEIDAFVAEWTRKLEQLDEVGIPMMTMSFGARNDRPDQEYQRANAVKAYDRVGAIARKYGVRMLLEVPHLYTIAPRPEEVFWIFDRLSSDNVGALPDCSHWGIIGYNVDEFFARLGDRLWHVHLRDSVGPDTGDRKQKLELTFGKGTVDLRKFGEALDKVGYTGEVTSELEYRDMCFNDIEAEYDYGLKYLASIGWELPEGIKTDMAVNFNQGQTIK